ncbi:hypothetical protein [Streptomyces mesophilus]|uniref:hypothetical protein n=1 Tax=Streptomyces mesophilus TaxID=1775132 RepID=UPI00331BAC48
MRKHAGRPAALAVPLLALATACSNPIDAPKAICGTPVDRDALTPLLPEEGEVTQSSKQLTLDEYCVVRVDKSRVLQIEIRELNEPLPAEDWIPDKELGYLSGKVTQLPFARRAIVGEQGALVETDCGNPSKYLLFRVDYSPVDGQSEATSKKVKGFIQDYVTAAKKQVGCTA